MRHRSEAVPKVACPPGATRRIHESPRPSGSAKAHVDDSAWLDAGHRLAISRRELEILRLLFDGQGEKQIAARLSISERTVHAHITRLYLRLAVHNRAQLLVRIFAALGAASEHWGAET